MSEHFLAKAKVDIFRPFTGKHRAIVFEVVVELYERTLGVDADYELVLDRGALTDLIVGELSRNRDLVFVDEEDDGLEADGQSDDRVVADKIRKRLKDFGVVEDYPDNNTFKWLWRFTAEGKRIAKMFADTRRKTAAARQRSIRACKAALRSYLDEGKHEFLVDAYEYASSIFDDICQISDLFADHQRRIYSKGITTPREAVDAYLAGVKDFDKRAKRYFQGDNIHNHANDLLDLTDQVEALPLATLVRLDKKIIEDNPAMEDAANGEPVHRWILDRIRRVILATRDIKHNDLHREVGEFSTRYALYIDRLMKQAANSDADPIAEFATMFAAANDEQRDSMAREVLWQVLPLRADITDPDAFKITERAERKVTPTKLSRPKPKTRDELLRYAIVEAMNTAFTMPKHAVLKRVSEAAAASGGSTSLTTMPVETASDLLAALAAVEIVRNSGPDCGFVVRDSRVRRSNGVFEAEDIKIVERA